MKKIQFTIDIKAPAQQVYETMLGLGHIETYQQWTAAFNPTSTYEGNWEKGSKMYFVGTDESGKRGGMVSEIAENIPNKFVSICHRGILDGENEITEGPMVEQWAGGLENYSFEEHEGITTVMVECDEVADEGMQEYFNSTWPKALAKLKEVIEQS